MTAWIRVLRYHLVQRFIYLVLPTVVLASAFVIDVLVLELTPAGHSGHRYVGGLGSIFVFLFLLGVQSVARSLPFGLSLGFSRRTFYLGTALLAIVLAGAWSLMITVGQIVERATGGWGLKMDFFRVPYILNGSWYLTLLTSFVTLALLFFFGAWFGLVYRRWNLVGLVTFIIGLIAVLLAGALAATWSHAWPNIGRFFTTLSAAGLTGVLAGLALVLLGGGFATMRRVTV
jgi:hypothetical protein